MSLVLTSSAFTNNGAIQSKYTCEGRDVSPPLAWSGAPAGTKSFALIMSDPDAPDPKAPQRIWTHWVVYNLPATAASLSEATTPDSLPKGAREGPNDWGRPDWGGPCPPIGRHRYYFRLYALDTVFDPALRPTREQLEKAMKGHVLESAELMGTYQKEKP
jgi:Raf kinase inhibitor-like YbhB/YbcL family protein